MFKTTATSYANSMYPAIFVAAQQAINYSNEPDWAIFLIYVLGIYLFVTRNIKIQYYSNKKIIKYIRDKTLAEKKLDDEVRLTTRNYYKSCVQPEYWANNNYEIDKETNRLKFTKEGEFLKPIFGKMNAAEFERYIKKNCDCRNPNQLAGCIILPIPQLPTLPKIINYHSCCLTSTTALKRAAAEMPDADPVVLEMFKTFLKKKIYPVLDSIANEFEYSFPIWWNHITIKQRQQVVQALDAANFQRAWTTISSLQKYGNFVKSEDQTQGPAESKTRNICNVGPLKKLLAGPVCYALEKIAKCKIDSYVSGKSYEEKGHDLAWISRKLGEDCVKLDGDGSAFDSCQKLPVKELVDDYLYNKVCKKIETTEVAKLNALGYAIPPYAIRAALMDHHAVIETKRCEDKKMKNLVTLTHDGTTHSGDMDTTLANTIRMWCYIEFVSYIAELKDIDYVTRVAGDDNSLYIAKSVFIKNKVKILKAYSRVFTLNKGKVTHGLGQVLKFLKVGKIEQGDFCSTSTFKTTRNGDTYYRVLRIPERYLLTFAYMSKSDSLTPGEYMYATGQAEMKWAKGLPIFQKLAEWKMRHGYDSSKIDLIKSSMHRVAHYSQCNNDFLDADLYGKIELSISEQEFIKRWDIKTLFDTKVNSESISKLIKDKILELYGIRNIRDDHINRAIKTFENKFKNTILGNHNTLRTAVNEPQDYQAYCDTLLVRHGITKDEIDDFEEYLDSVDPMDETLEHVVITKLGRELKPQLDATKYFSCPEKFRLNW